VAGFLSTYKIKQQITRAKFKIERGQPPRENFRKLWTLEAAGLLGVWMVLIE